MLKKINKKFRAEQIRPVSFIYGYVLKCIRPDTPMFLYKIHGKSIFQYDLLITIGLI